MAGSPAMQAFEGMEEFTCDDGGDNELGECTGTVGQLETCVNDMLDTFEELLNQFTCDDAANVDMQDFEGLGDMAGASPASCEAVGCPGGSPFGGDDETAQ
jgi:hypothetical protein